MIADIKNRITFVGDGVNTAFPFPFSALSKDNLIVTLLSTDNEEETLTANYFIDLESGIVYYPGYPPGVNQPENEMPQVLPVGWKLTITRKTVISQESTLGDKWPFTVIEKGIDKLTMIAQDVKGVTNRSIRLPEGADGNINTVLPIPTPNGFFQWDEEGKNLIGITDPIATAHNIQLNSDRAVTAANQAESNATYSFNSATTSYNASVNATVSANSASVSASSAMSASNLAITSADEALASASSASSASNAANSFANEASAFASSASSYATVATTSATTATGQALLAKDYADQAKESAGGDFVTKAYADENYITSVTETNGTIEVERGDGSKTSFTSFSIDSCYPVGAIYMSTVATSPNTLFGGTWEALEQGRVLLSQGTDYEAGSIGGKATHAISIAEMPSHSHSGSTENSGEHNHGGSTAWNDLQGWGESFMRKLDSGYPNPSTGGVISSGMGGNSPYVSNYVKMDGTGQQVRYNLNVSHSHSFTTSSSGSHNHSITLDDTGDGVEMSLMQPYLAVYMWKRVS